MWVLLYLLALLPIESDGPFVFEHVLSHDKLKYLDAWSLSIAQKKDGFYLLSRDDQVIFDCSRDGRIIHEYRSKEGRGPGEFGKSSVLFCMANEVVFVNNLNRQAVFLDKNLNFIKNERLRHAAYAGLARNDKIWLQLKGEPGLLGEYDKQLRFRGQHFQSRLGNGLSARYGLTLSQAGVFYYPKIVIQDKEYVIAWRPFDKTGEIDVANAAWQTIGEPMPKNFTSPDRLIGTIHRVKMSGKYVIVEIVLENRLASRVSVFDVFYAENGSFYRRHIADYGMIRGLGPDAFFLRNGVLVRLLTIKQ